MDLETVRRSAKEKLQGYCRICPVCNGKFCSGEVPGMGGIGNGSSFTANIEALAKYRLNLRTIHEVKEPKTTFELWGQKLDFPILAAPMTGTPYNMGGKLNEEQFITAIITGALQAGSLGMCGDGADPAMYESGLQAIKAQSGRGIAIIKPRSQKEILKRLREAEESQAVAVGVDIDGAGLITMAMKGQPVSPKSFSEIKELISSTKLPFILKGIMTVDEAEMAAEAGAAAIVVSNHGGRILESTPGAAEVLPKIADKVKDKLVIFADGGVRSGADALKLLALGANAVLVGRPLVPVTFGSGCEGVSFLLKKFKDELFQAMLLCGVPDVKNVSRKVIYTP